MNFEDFEILSKGFRRWKFEMKILEALLMKENKPFLIRQEKSDPLKLFD